MKTPTYLRPGWALLLAGGLLGCSPSSPPPKPSAPPPQPTATRPPPAEQPAAPEPVSDFQPPALQRPITLQLTSGLTKRGTLVGLDEDSVSLQLGVATVTYDRRALSPASRQQLFARDYAAAAERPSPPSAPPATITSGDVSFRIRSKSKPPRNDPRDHSVASVRSYVLEHARNPGSVHFTTWGPVQKHKGGYYVRCHYEVDGGELGAMQLDKVFFLNERGEVVRTSAGTGQL